MNVELQLTTNMPYADDPNRSLFTLEGMQMLTKLRPFVRKFLKEASTMFEMYIYTMGDKAYAIEIAKLLDPRNVYFDSKVISNSDCTQRHQKGLDMVLGAESVAVILDDTEYVSAFLDEHAWHKFMILFSVLAIGHEFVAQGMSCYASVTKFFWAEINP
jgi:FCP1-like phosphatase family protein